MSLVRSPALAMAIAILGVAAMLGGTLGIATAGQASLNPGQNLVGGPIISDVDPDHYVECLPEAHWKAIFIWRSDVQEWRHYFNTSADVPDYVNDTRVGAMDTVPRLSGVVVLMTSDYPGGEEYFPNGSHDSCPQ